jgi:hypothetical protein
MPLGPRRASRRLLIGGSASALSTAALLGPAPQLFAQTDRGLLDLLYALEQIQVALYEAVLDAFDQDAFAAMGFPPTARAEMTSILAADRAHLEVLERPDEAPEPPTVATDTDTLTTAIEEAITLKNLTIAAYAGIIPVLGRQRLIPELLGIHSVEARHAAFLNSLIGGNPFPDAVDAALAPEDVLARIEGMVQNPSATPVATPGAADPLVAAIASDLGVAADEIQVVSIEPRQWPDTALGCPQPGMMYAQVITPGSAIIVSVGGKQLEYHTDEQGTVVRCS